MADEELLLTTATEVELLSMRHRSVVEDKPRSSSSASELLSGMSVAAKRVSQPGHECFELYKDGWHDGLAKHWPEPRSQLHAGGQATTDAFVEQYRAQLVQGVRVLDICCGEGGTVADLAAKFPASTFTGLDIVQSAITVAMRAAAGRDNASFVKGTIFALPFPDEAFDLVLAQDPDGFTHNDRAVAFKEVCRVLRPRGGFYLTHHWIPGSGWDAEAIAEWQASSARIFWPVSSDDYVRSAVAAGFHLSTAENLTQLAGRHLRATAKLVAAAEGSVNDKWLATSLDLLERGLPFGVRLVGHREDFVELVHLEKYDILKAQIQDKTNAEILQIRDSMGFTVLHHAAKDGKLDFCKWLIEERGMPVDITDGNGSYPVYRAIGFGRDEVREYLVSKGADLTHINDHGSSALHNTCDVGEEDLSFYLVERGLCDPFLPSDRGSTPVSLAVGKLHVWVAWIFKKKITEVKRFVRWRLHRYDLAFLDLNEDVDNVDSVIYRIVKRGATDLLMHPLVHQYIKLRWNAFGARKAGLEVAEHVFDLAVFVAFALSLQFQGVSLAREIWVIIFAVALLCVSAKSIIKEFQQWRDSTLVETYILCRRWRHKSYWTDTWNYTELVIYGVCTGTAVLVLTAIATEGLGAATYADSSAMSDVLMITMLLFFTRTLKFLAILPVIGPFVKIIFQMASRDMLIFGSFFAVFWGAFSVAFFVRYSEAEIGSPWSIFRDVLSILVTGESDAVRDVVENAPFVPQAVYLLCLISLSLLLSNLLIAMLVNTYESIQYAAGAHSLMLRADFILEIQKSIPPAVRNELLRKESMRAFHKLPVENATTLDTHALARNFEFSHEVAWAWTDQSHEEEKPAVSQNFLFRQNFMKALREVETRMAVMWHAGEDAAAAHQESAAHGPIARARARRLRRRATRKHPRRVSTAF